MANECPRCQTNNPDSLKFCGECGTHLSSADEAQESFTKTLETPREGIVPGTIFASRYKVIEELGRGGMGVVYKAEDSKLKRTVAIKLLPPELTGNKEARERFTREAQSAAVLDHPNICTIYEVDESDDKIFISMAYVDGQNLRERIKAGPLDISEGLDFGIKVSEGLAAAHNKGIVHRDIKSSNIMVTKQGQAKIMDFGLAKLAGNSLITHEGVTMGTVAYMSPEQAQGKAVDHRSDIWSLGVVLYEMFGGRLPFKGETEASFLYSIVHEDPPALKEVNPDIPIEIQKIINRTLKKKPQERYQSAANLASDLRTYLDRLKAKESGLYNLRNLFRRLKQPKVAVPSVIILAAAAFFAVQYFSRQSKALWAKDQAIPEIVRLIDADKLVDAYFVTKNAEKYIPNSRQLAELKDQFSWPVSINTTPEGADIFFGRFDDSLEELEYLGRSPVNDTLLPQGYLRLKIVKDRCAPFQTVLHNYRFAAEKPAARVLNFALDEAGELPEGMLRIPAQDLSLSLAGFDSLEEIPTGE